MGAYLRGGYEFEVEFSQIQQKGAMHVYRDGQYLQELPFYFTGVMPNNLQLEELMEDFITNS